MLLWAKFLLLTVVVDGWSEVNWWFEVIFSLNIILETSFRDDEVPKIELLLIGE